MRIVKAIIGLGLILMGVWCVRTGEIAFMIFGALIIPIGCFALWEGINQKETDKEDK